MVGTNPFIDALDGEIQSRRERNSRSFIRGYQYDDDFFEGLQEALQIAQTAPAGEVIRVVASRSEAPGLSEGRAAGLRSARSTLACVAASVMRGSV
ncbi:MAG TPA: hypothetical protein VN737_18680 [Bryobacteraceae bacterium]|jgi:hypothetical protein|nr:hypothetical protein [Bryobacteraceae bacterium]